MVVESNVLIIISLFMTELNTVVSQNFEGYIVEGDFAGIREFPHSAFLYIEAPYGQNQKMFFSCGSSILNQAILITAAHCLESCRDEYSSITAFVGSKARMQGTPYLSASFKIHEDYDTDEICNDIGLVRLKKPLVLGKTVRRVALLKDPPHGETADVAGWGYVNEYDSIGAPYLMTIKQKVWSREDCIEELGESTPKGTICGGKFEAPSYVAPGDSGSGLMVRKYIQIGLVSYKDPGVSNSLVIYTDASYFYKWIKKNAKILYCGDD